MTNSQYTKKGAVLVLLCAVEFMIAADFSIVNVALPSIQRALGFSKDELQWVVSAYALAFGGFLIFGGRIADLFGRRRVLMGGLALLVASSLIAGLAQDTLMLVLLRGAQGMGAALIAPSALALLTTTFTEDDDRQRALAAWGSVLGAGFVSGVIAGGLLTQYAGWRWVVLINVPTAALTLACCPLLLKPTGERRTGARHLDVPGALTITGAILAIVYAVSQGPVAGWVSAGTLGTAAGAIALLVLFVIAESRTPEPLVPLSVFRIRQVAVANGVNMLLIGSFVGVIYVVTLFLQNVHGYSPLETGLCFALPGAAGFTAGQVSGHLAGRFGIRVLLVAGTLLQAIAALVLLTLPSSDTALVVIACMMVFNFADVMGIVMINIGATAGIPDESQGLAAGLLNASQQVGSAIGLAVISAITVAAASHAAASQTATAALVDGYRWGLAGAAIISIAAAVLAAVGLRSSRARVDDAGSAADLDPAEA